MLKLGGSVDPDCERHVLRRRDALYGAGAVAFSAVATSLLAGAEPAAAEPLKSPVPEVDRVAVRVVVDNYQFALAPGIKRDTSRYSASGGDSATNRRGGR
jgi:hypothetical protein